MKMKMSRIEIVLTAGIGIIQKILVEKGLTTNEELQNRTDELAKTLLDSLGE